MSDMTAVSYRGKTFTSVGATVILQGPLGDLTLSGSYVGGGEDDPVFTGVNRQPRQLACQAWVNPENWEHDRDVLLEVLRFDLSGADAMGALVMEREDGTQVTIQARPKEFKSADTIDAEYSLIFESAGSDWVAVAATNASVTGPAVAGNPVSTALALAGTSRTRPQITLTPQKAKTVSPTYASSYTITEADGITCYNIPYLITFNHAAAVTAGQSTASGTDILVYVAGQQVPRSVVNPNTSATRVVFQVPLLLGAASVPVVLQYAPSGQNYGLGGYAQDYVTSIVTEQSGQALAPYPYSITINHAAIVTAGRSQSSGADIRVLVNGTEVQRTVNDANTSSTQVFFPLTVGAGTRVVVSILTSASGYDYALATYTNGSMDLTKSTNGQWIYSTPNNDGAIAAGLANTVGMTVVGGYAVPGTTAATSTNDSGANPSWKQTVNFNGSGSTSANYLCFWASGITILSVAYELVYQTPNDINSVIGAAARVASTTNIFMTSGWSSETSYQNTAQTEVAYATKTLQTGAKAVALGIERTTANALSTNATASWSGNGANDLLLNLDTTTTPATASQTLPTLVSAGSGFNYPLTGLLTDGTRTLTIASLALVDGQSLVIDAPSHSAWLTDASGIIAGSQLASRAAITVTSPDSDWLACEPQATTTFTWTDVGVDADGMEIAASASVSWR